MSTLSAIAPSYLADHRGLYRRDPHAAAFAWFADARFGLFMHYGFCGIPGREERAMMTGGL